MRGSSASEKVPFSSERKLMTEMVRRYAHLSAEHLAPYADRLGEVQVVAERIHGTNPSQCPE